MHEALSDKLVLNGKKDPKGRMLYDTASKFVANRRSICNSVHSQFERWDKKKCLTVEFLQDKIDELENQLKGDNIADPYIGVRLYLYKWKQEKMKKHS